MVVGCWVSIVGWNGFARQRRQPDSLGKIVIDSKGKSEGKIKSTGKFLYFVLNIYFIFIPVIAARGG